MMRTQYEKVERKVGHQAVELNKLRQLLAERESENLALQSKVVQLARKELVEAAT